MKKIVLNEGLFSSWYVYNCDFKWRTDDTLITYYWRICVQRLRSAVRIALCCCFGADVLNGINEAAARGDRMTFPEDGYRLSVGSIFGLLFARLFYLVFPRFIPFVLSGCVVATAQKSIFNFFLSRNFYCVPI